MDTNLSVAAAAAPIAGPRTVLNAEHEMFRDAVRRFFERHVVPHHRQCAALFVAGGRGARAALPDAV